MSEWYLLEEQFLELLKLCWVGLVLVGSSKLVMSLFDLSDISLNVTPQTISYCHEITDSDMHVNA